MMYESFSLFMMVIAYAICGTLVFVATMEAQRQERPYIKTPNFIVLLVLIVCGFLWPIILLTNPRKSSSWIIYSVTLLAGLFTFNHKARLFLVAIIATLIIWSMMDLILR